MKRIIAALILCAIILVGSFAVWQPTWLRHAVIHEVTDRVDRSTPYRLEIGTVRWNLLHGLALKQIRLTSKKSGVELFTASALQMRLQWLALFHHEVRLSRLRLVDPVLLIPLQDQEWVASSTSTSKAPLIFAKEIDIVDGTVILRPHREDTAHEVRLSECEVEAQLSPDALDLEHVDFKLGDGRVKAHGDVALHPIWKARMTFDTYQFPLDKLLRLTAPKSDLRLRHSGHTLITAGAEHMTLITTGELAGAPLSASGMWRTDSTASKGRYEAKVEWSGVSMDNVYPGPLFRGAQLSSRLQVAGEGVYPNVSGELSIRRDGVDGKPDQMIRARMQWVRGSGPVQLMARYGGLTAEATGQANIQTQSAQGDFDLNVSSLSSLDASLSEAAGTLRANGHFMVSPRGWLVKGQGDGHNGYWQGHTLKTLHYTFQADPRSIAVHADADELRIHASQNNPWDVMKVNGSLVGSMSSWTIDLAPTFRNKAGMDVKGKLSRLPKTWELDTSDLRLNVPEGGTWEAEGSTRLTFDENKRAECQNLVLVQGTQRAEFRDLVWSPSDTRVDLSLHLDPSMFNGVQPAVDFSKGSSLDVQWKAEGQWPDFHSRGTLKGQSDHLTIKPIGLTLKHWNCSVQSTDQVFDIDPCSAELSKGNISLTGHSALPSLQLALRGTKVSVDYGKTFKGTGTMAIDLAGTLQAPELRGKVTLIDAVYNPSAEKKKSTPAPASTAVPTPPSPLWRNTLIDLAAQWPRDVWYRDGASSIETHGDLRVQKVRGDPEMRLTGTITSVRGNYSYLGRSFSINSAQLQFPNTPGFDPLINVEASYPAEAITVYLDITRSIHQPVLKLRSSPPLSDQDIISVIAFGQPISELRSSGGVTTNQQMEAAAGSVLGGYVTDKLRNTGIAPLQFDVMNVQSTSQGSQLTIGRYLTRRLYVSYGQTLSATAGKAFNADYFLTDRWILEGETGTTQGNYADLLFRYPINGSGTDTTSNMLQSPFRNTLDVPAGLGQPPLPSSSAP